VALPERPSYSRTVTAPLYNRDILRLAASVPHLGRLTTPAATAERSSAVCGSRVLVDLHMAAGRVSALGLEVRACALGQAAACLMARHAIGRTAEELASARDALADFLAGHRETPGEWPEISILAAARPYSARHPSILLPFEAAAAAAALAPVGD
jgi:NifU-like protein involved in Fe-S cluster formation